MNNRYFKLKYLCLAPRNILNRPVCERLQEGRNEHIPSRGWLEAEVFDFTLHLLLRKDPDLQLKVVLCDVRPPSSKSTGFPGKEVVIPCPQDWFLNLLASCVMSSEILNLITGIFESFLNTVWCRCDGWMTGRLYPSFHVPVLTKIWYQVTYKTLLPRHTVLVPGQVRHQPSQEFNQCHSSSAGEISKASCTQGLWVLSFC